MNKFYVYSYLREDGTPYYIGKGKGIRAYKWHGKLISVPKDKSRIKFIKTNLREDIAFALEIMWIAFYGRKDNGTGILHNKTDGGEGLSNISEETKQKMSYAKKGKPSPKKGIPSGKKGIPKGTKGRPSPLTGTKKTTESLLKGRPSSQRGMTKRKNQRIICPHCQKEGGIAGMKRYHLDKCKLNLNNIGENI